MHVIRLVSLQIADFKALSSFSFRPEGKNANVCGANASGKSTLMTAFLWLLSGKDAQGRSDYNIFPIGSDGLRVSGCFPAVSAVLDLGDGRTVRLSRALVEKMSKRTGTAQPEYRGDETKCSIDDVPTSMTGYSNYIETLCPVDMLPLLLNASWFAEHTKDYRERRELLLRTFGEISESEILASTPQLAPLAARLDGHNVDGYFKICTERRKKYNDTLNSIPARIDENRQRLQSLPEEKSVRTKISKLNVEIAKLQYAVNNTDAGVLLRRKTQELENANAALASISTKRQTMRACGTAEWSRDHDHRLNDVMLQKREAQDVFYSADSAHRQHSDEKRRLEESIEQLRVEWQRENAQLPHITDICPTCGQPLPPESVLTARENFNVAKSALLSEIMQRAQQKKAKLADTIDLAEKAKCQLADAEQQLVCANELLLSVQKDIPPEVNTDHLDAEETALKVQIAEINSAIADADEAAKQAAREYQAELEALSKEAADQSQLLAQIQQDALIRARIHDLEEEQRAALQMLEDTELSLSLCEEYTRTMVTALTERVNQYFETVRFRLFEPLKNGGLKEICEATLDGVPYGSLNTAGKMQTNVEIVRAFSDSAGYTLPLFLDNRESVSVLAVPDDMQTIHLYVDPAQPVLTYTI